MLQEACSVIRGRVQLKQSLVFKAVKYLTVNVSNLKKSQHKRGNFIEAGAGKAKL